MAEAGCIFLTLTGGEVFTRPDFMDIYEYCANHGFVVKVFTNATLITDRDAARFAARPPRVIEVSLYGADAECHDRITRVPGSFSKTMANVVKLRSKELSVALKIVVMKSNLHQVEAMEALASDLGCSVIHELLVTPKLDGTLPDDMRLTPEEMVAFDMSKNDRVSTWKEIYGELHGTPRPDPLYICPGGRRQFHINARGGLGMCPRALERYDLLQGSFREGWDVFLGDLIKKTLPRDHRCAQCDHYFLCTQCPVLSQLETGLEFDAVPYLCQAAGLKHERIKRALEDLDGADSGELTDTRQGLPPPAPDSVPSAHAIRDEAAAHSHRA